jgi:hypothetical protein
MPIDFAAIAERFRERLESEAKRATLAQRAVAQVLGKRRSTAAAVELATRGFPIVRFYDEAVTMKITAAQKGAVELTAPPQAFLDQLWRGAQAGWEGFFRVIPRVDEATVINRFAGGLERTVAEIEASVRRFEKPTAEMFEPDARRGSDLFGLAALAFRTLAEASRRGGEVDRLTGQVRATLAIVRGGETPAAGEGAAPARSLTETLDAAGLQLVGATVAIGVLPRLLVVLLEGAVLRVKVWLLDELTAIERHVLDFRANVFRRAFTGLTAWADRGIDIASAVHRVVGSNLAFMLRFWRELGTQVARGVRDFVVQLTNYLRDWVTLLNALPGWIDVLVRFDLSELLRSSLGRVVSVIPSFSLSDLLDSDARRVNIGLRERLLTAIDAAEAAAGGVAGLLGPVGRWIVREKIRYVRRQARRARWLVRELFPGPSLPPGLLGTVFINPPVPFPAEAPPLRFRSDAPNLYETLFGGGRGARIVGFFHGLESSVQGGISEGVTRTIGGLSQLSTVFGTAAAQAARFRRGDELERVAGEASLLAGGVFGPEVESERKALERRAPDAVARAFESWLADGGFVLIGEAIPAYVGEAARHWYEQVLHGEELTAPLTATSPRILRRRAVLGKVTMRRMTLWSAPGEALEAELADRVADRFEEAVAEAYETGRARLRELAAQEGP